MQAISISLETETHPIFKIKKMFRLRHMLTLVVGVLISTSECHQLNIEDNCSAAEGDTLCSENESSKIYPELLGLDQHSPVLIEALKTRILIPPSKQMPQLTDPSQG